MKTKLITILSAALITAAHAEFRSWTNDEGQVAELELLSVIETDGEKVGEFKTRDGKKVKVKQSALVEDDAKKLDHWTPPFQGEDVFKSVLEENLLELDGGKLEDYEGFETPKKYYLFYYTASWCGPCQRYTPSLVNWYKENKNDNFEIVLISSDRDKKAMEGYTKSKKMPWPHLKMSETAKFKKEFKHGVRGIPSLIVCDPAGKMLGNYRGRHEELTELVKD